MYERGSRSSGFAIVKFPALESSAALNSILFAIRKRRETVAQSCKSFWRGPLIRANKRWVSHHMDSYADARERIYEEMVKFQSTVGQA